MEQRESPDKPRPAVPQVAFAGVAYRSLRGKGVIVTGGAASRDAVLGRLGGQPLEGTAQGVASDELDERGQYLRLATGWGETG